MSAPEVKKPDEKRIVALLAKESQVPLAEVAKLYEHEHAKLSIGAHITKFLHILAIRNVQEILRKRGLERPAKPVAGGPLLAAERLPRPLGSTWSTASAIAEKSPRP